MSNPSRRLPDVSSETRLADIRRKASEGKPLDNRGLLPLSAPFPHASADNGYYGLPLLKEPQWNPEVPLYFFVGGAAGAAAILGNAAAWLRHDPALVRSARWIAAVGAFISPVLLIRDLGVPSRFINMLRVVKPRSPMSLGAWTLMAFSSSAASAAAAQLIKDRVRTVAPVNLIGEAAGVVSAATGLVMTSYTGVLIGATVIPVWNHHAGTLPLHFAASAMNSAVSILELFGHDHNRALNLLGLSASAYETAQAAQLELQRTEVSRPLREGKSGWLVRTGALLSGPVPLILRVGHAISGSRRMRRAAAICSIAGSLLTRFGWMSAGKVSAKNAALSLRR